MYLVSSFYRFQITDLRGKKWYLTFWTRSVSFVNRRINFHNGTPAAYVCTSCRLFPIMKSHKSAYLKVKSILALDALQI